MHKDNIIGLNSENLNLYINEKLSIKDSINIIKGEINTIHKYIKTQKIDKTTINNIICRVFKLEKNENKLFKDINGKYYDMLNKYKNYYNIYYYNPIEVNNIIIKDDNIPDYRIENLNKSLYDTNIYNLLLIDIVSKIHKLKNTKLRSKIIYIFSNLNKNDINKIKVNLKNEKIYELINSLNLKDSNYTIYEELQFKLKIVNEILIFLKNILIQNENNKNLKKIIIEKFNDVNFSFDNLHIYDLLRKNKDDFVKEIKKLLQNSIINKKVNTNEEIIDIGSCSNIKKSYYCDNKKLIVQKELYNKLLEIFYYDITNKYKQKIILNLVNYNINNIYKFNYYRNEKIYIYL
jgi:hypothetical protein